MTNAQREKSLLIPHETETLLANESLPSAGLNLTIMNPADNLPFELSHVSPDITPAEIVAELVKQGHLPALPSGQGYILALQGGHQLDETQGLGANGVPNGAVLQLIAPTPGAATDTLRRERLQGDAREMNNIRCRFINWQAENTSAPAVYLVTYFLPSYLDSCFTRRDVHCVRCEVGPGYPFEPPLVRLLTQPPIFHPNVFPDGRICIGNRWSPEEGLAFLVIRVAKMLLYYDTFTNPGHPANQAAASWYRQNRAHFPLGGKLAFPDPITGALPKPTPFFILRGGAQR
jgi:ubiquitin-protein ligase